MATSETGVSPVISLDQGAFKTVIESNDVVLVEFYTEWCSTCKRMEPLLESIASETSATVLAVDIESHLETAIEFGAQSPPSFVVFADGRPVEQLRGGQTRTTLRELIDTYLA